jgi:hypothetical protein
MRLQLALPVTMSHCTVRVGLKGAEARAKLSGKQAAS